MTEEKFRRNLINQCVNPWHMEPVAQKENILRGASSAARHAVKTHCDRGHEYTAENTYRQPGRPHTRECRKCRRHSRSRRRPA